MIGFAGFGLLLLLLALVLMMRSGWPTCAVLLGVCALGAAVGAAFGGFDAGLLGSLPGRVVGLLDHDLLQALALYALVGALLHRLQLAGDLHAGLQRALARAWPRSAPALASLSLGALLAPMNGSVGASVMALSQVGAGASHEPSPPAAQGDALGLPSARQAALGLPSARQAALGLPSARQAALGLPSARQAALVAVASTLGVVVPPSLVLLLLGDAMLRAHTEGLNLARQLHLPLADANLRVMNTQDLLQAVLVPAAALLLGWWGITAWRMRSGTAADAARRAAAPSLRRATAALAIVPSVIAALLTLVAIGQVRAVEAAATAGVLLLLWGALSGRLTRRLLWQALDDAMALTGALFALLLAATSFSLLLRGLGTDRLVAEWMLQFQGQPMLATFVAMALLLACAFVLDAFELIFLVVPIVMPPLLAQVGDAAWVAVLALLVLQAGFLLPPFGYAVVLARGAAGSPTSTSAPARPPMRAMAQALMPYLAWLACVLALVAAAPQITLWLRTAPLTLTTGPAMNNDDVERMMRAMSQPPEAASTPSR